MEKEIKRKKLTLSILGGTKKPKTKIEIAKAQNRNSIIIEKKNNRFSKPLNKPFHKASRLYKFHQEYFACFQSDESPPMKLQSQMYHAQTPSSLHSSV